MDFLTPLTVSGRIQQLAEIAQLVEHTTENCGVLGPIPSLGTKHPGDRVFLNPSACYNAKYA
jgi:hypothetical protein